MNDLHIWREGGRYEILIPSIKDDGLFVKMFIPSEQGLCVLKRERKGDKKPLL
jgi:hypothetical protein